MLVWPFYSCTLHKMKKKKRLVLKLANSWNNFTQQDGISRRINNNYKRAKSLFGFLQFFRVFFSQSIIRGSQALGRAVQQRWVNTNMHTCARADLQVSVCRAYSYFCFLWEITDICGRSYSIVLMFRAKTRCAAVSKDLQLIVRLWGSEVKKK